MKKRGILAALALAAVTAITSGCIVVAHPGPGYHHIYGPVVVVGPGHVHTEYCGHFWYGGHWYLAEGHRHCVGCGHVWRGGMWVVVD